jgi:hypothetical protein
MLSFVVEYSFDVGFEVGVCRVKRKSQEEKGGLLRREPDDLLGNVDRVRATAPRRGAITPSRRTCLAGRLVRAVLHQQPSLAGSSVRILRAAPPLRPPPPPPPPEQLRLHLHFCP